MWDVEGIWREVLRGLNETMIRIGVEQFCTVVYARIERSGREIRVTIARGGHPPPHVLRSDGRVEVIRPEGTLIGVFDDSQYLDHPVDLAPGDALVVFTDGLVERNEELERLGGLARALEACRGLSANEITDRLAGTLEHAPPKDDAVVVTIESGP